LSAICKCSHMQQRFQAAEFIPGSGRLEPWSLAKHQELGPRGAPVCWWISSSFGGFHAVASVPDGADRRRTRPHPVREGRPISSLLHGSLGSSGIRVESQSAREPLLAPSDARSASRVRRLARQNRWLRDP